MQILMYPLKIISGERNYQGRGRGPQGARCAFYCHDGPEASLLGRVDLASSCEVPCYIVNDSPNPIAMLVVSIILALVVLISPRAPCSAFLLAMKISTLPFPIIIEVFVEVTSRIKHSI